MSDDVSYSVDLEKFSDPAGLSHVYDAVRALHERSHRIRLAPVVVELERLTLLIPRGHPYESELKMLFSLFEGVLTGKSLVLDENEEPADADSMQAASDWLGGLAAGKGIVQIGEGLEDELDETAS